VTEFEDTVVLANKILDRISADPDDELAMLARQFLRSREMENRLKTLLTRAADALDIMTQFLLISDVPLEWEENKRRENTALIAELRKAAG
jgi:hypothetical protein